MYEYPFHKLPVFVLVVINFRSYVSGICDYISEFERRFSGFFLLSMITIKYENIRPGY